jgi:hypothetical protein
VLGELAVRELVIDIVRAPCGLDPGQVFRTSLRVEVLDDDRRPKGARFRVMHPVLLLESRAHDVKGLPGGDSPRARKQLRAAVLCARELLRDRLDERLVRPVLDLDERIYGFCVRNHHGRRVYAVTGIDPIDAVLVDDRLPADFVTKRYPQVRERLGRVRRKLTGSTTR